MSRTTANTMDTLLQISDLRAYQQTEEIIADELFAYGPLNRSQSIDASRRLMRRFAKSGISLHVPASIVEAVDDAT